MRVIENRRGKETERDGEAERPIERAEKKKELKMM